MINIQQEIKEKGFVHIPNAFSEREIKELVNATQATLDNSNYEYDFLKMNTDQHIHKIRYMFEKDPVFLKALVHDSVLSAVTQIIDDETSIVPTWEDMLIKIPFKGIPVNAHQDLALQSVGSDVFGMGIYLHDSGSNPVYYLPKSFEMGPLTRTEINEVYNRERSKFVPVRARAGDIVIHNVKTVHFSEENKTPDPRYTWYLEFRTKEQLLKDSPWDEEWINQRRAIWVNSLKKYKKNIDYLIPDYQELTSYISPLNLRVSHINETVNYDMKSPYNHFSDE